MSWEQLGLSIYEGAYLDFIGYSTSLSNNGTIVAIGAIGDDYAGTDSGSVSIFQYSRFAKAYKSRKQIKIGHSQCIRGLYSA